jgi:argininosuccinate lyase
VGKCTAEGKTFADLSDEEWAEVHPVFATQKPPLTAEESVALRDLPGGTAPRQVAMALELAQAATHDARAWVEQERAAREDVLSKP